MTTKRMACGLYPEQVLRLAQALVKAGSPKQAIIVIMQADTKPREAKT